MKKITCILLLLLSATVMAQKIKIKKGKLLIDKKEVCLFEKKENRSYLVSNLDGSKEFMVTVASEKGETLEGEKQVSQVKYWRPDTEEFYYSDYDTTGLKFTFSASKFLASFLFHKKEFITKEGIDKELIQNFFSSPKPKNDVLVRLENEYQKEISKIIGFGLVVEKDRFYKVRTDEELARLNVKGNKEKYRRKYLGKFLVQYDKFDQITLLNIFDATSFSVAQYNTIHLNLFDGKSIKYIRNDLSKINFETSARKILERLIIEGYTFGDTRGDIRNQKLKEEALVKKQKKEAALKKELNETVNIYNQQAIVYTSEGVVEGKGNLEFSELKSIKHKGMLNLSSYGGDVVLESADPKNPYKKRFYKAKDGVRVYFKNLDEYYVGVDLMKGKMKFNKEIEIGGPLELYFSPKYNYYILKRKDQEKGISLPVLDPLTKFNMVKKSLNRIDEYFSDKSDFLKSNTLGGSDLLSELVLKEFVRKYNAL